MSESSPTHPPSARPFWRTPSVLAACLSAAIALVLAAAIRPGSHASSLSQFIGRFHPLVVHLPIGILLALALAESLTWSRRLRERVDPVVGLVIPVLAGSAVASVFLGLLMAHSGGYPSRLVALHRGFTLAAVAGAAACALA